ncbi:MAG: hypothetical protein LUH82_07465 [Clostridiales bacterium]|nr:hypothetical protein [Clostridiales bacterium]
MSKESKLQKMQEKAAKQHEKAYNKFVLKETKKNAAAAKKAAAGGEAYESQTLPSIDE